MLFRVVKQWNAELAYLAELNARSCHYGHDKCRATSEFLLLRELSMISVSLLAMLLYNICLCLQSNSNTLARILRDVEIRATTRTPTMRSNTWLWTGSTNIPMLIWVTLTLSDCTMKGMSPIYFHFNQSCNSLMHPASCYTHSRKKIGHFTVMVNEKTSQIGCALVKHQSNGFKYKYFVCNYSYTNFLGEAVYTPGESCSGCKAGCHRIYRGLCHEKESVPSEPMRWGSKSMFSVLG